MKTYAVVITVLQSGNDFKNARAILENNLGTVLEPKDFEVSNVSIEVPEKTNILNKGSAIADF